MRYALARRFRSIIRYAKHTLAPTPTDYERRRAALHQQLARELAPKLCFTAVARALGIPGKAL
jgi:hypothetical protein